MKELEKAGGKAGTCSAVGTQHGGQKIVAGLHEKQVKDINAALLDDNLVRQDKIGQVNVFWSFPATHAAELQAEVRAAQRQVVEARERLVNARASEAQALVGREDPDGSRAIKVREFKALAENRKALEAELERLKANDPEELCRLQKAAADCKDHANRWAENLCVVPSARALNQIPGLP